MFYCRGGIDETTQERKLFWVCDNDGKISVCETSPGAFENDSLLFDLEHGKIRDLSEVDAYLSVRDFSWDEDAWDIYNEKLVLVGRTARLGE